MITVSVYAAVNTRTPRGASWAASAVLSIWRLLAGLVGQRATSAAPTPAAEAAAVRELARQFTVSDPGFAADLYAAADRHEALHDAG
jgi:hypothetical protein